MPQYYGPVRATKPNANSPLFPLGVPPVLPVNPPEGYPKAPYPGDLNAGNGVKETFKPGTNYTTNVSQPDNTQAPVTAAGDGKNGMAG